MTEFIILKKCVHEEESKCASDTRLAWVSRQIPTIHFPAPTYRTFLIAPATREPLIFPTYRAATIIGN